MRLEDPELRLAGIRTRNLQLQSEAAADRSARCSRDGNRFSGIQIHFGSWLIVVGRSLADEATSPRPARP